MQEMQSIMESVSSRSSSLRSLSHFTNKDPDQPKTTGDYGHKTITNKLPETVMTMWSNRHDHLLIFREVEIPSLLYFFYTFALGATEFLQSRTNDFLGLMEGEIRGRVSTYQTLCYHCKNRNLLSQSLSV